MKQPATTPNILLILTDQQRYDTLGCNGSVIARTPNLDALANCGVVFDNHFVANPVCTPSRASIWTGQYPSSHGAWANGCSLEPSTPTIASHLATNGYQTAHFGKMHLVPILNRVTPHPPYGFATFEVAEGDQQYAPDDAYFNWLRSQDPVGFAEFLEELYTKGQAIGYPSKLRRSLHQSEWTVDRCTDWLQSGRDPERPFFLSAGFFDPHHAFNPLKEFWDAFEATELPEPARRDDRDQLRPAQYLARHRGLEKYFSDQANLHATIRAYHAMVSHVDSCLGRLFEALNATGERDNTIIVFSSDHGELLGDLGMLWKGPFMLDSLLRVPLIVAGPGMPQGERVSSPTASIDLFPSLATLAGAPATNLAGRAWFNPDGALRPLDSQRAVYAEWDAPGDGPDSCLRMLRRPDAKLIASPEHPDYGEYYDLKNDPCETLNIWNPEDPNQIAMREELLTRWHQPRPATPCIKGW